MDTSAAVNVTMNAFLKSTKDEQDFCARLPRTHRSEMERDTGGLDVLPSGLIKVQRGLDKVLPV
jgi:hypothetical protein